MKNYRKKIYKYYANASGYDLAPTTVQGFNQRKPFFQYIIDEHFPKEKNISILEVGCGHGAFGYFIQKHGYKNYVGVDGSASQVAEAQKLNVKNIKYADLVEYLKNTQSNSIKLLIAIDVIEHFNKVELSDLVDEFYRVLSVDGSVITHQPNGASPFGGAIRYGDFTHELAFTHTSISQIFLSSEFSSVRSYEDSPIAHGMKSSIRLFLWNFLIKPVYKIALIIETGWVEKNIILSKNFLSIIKK